jgi:hypothetical protein
MLSRAASMHCQRFTYLHRVTRAGTCAAEPNSVLPVQSCAHAVCHAQSTSSCLRLSRVCWGAHVRTCKLSDALGQPLPTLLTNEEASWFVCSSFSCCRQAVAKLQAANSATRMNIDWQGQLDALVDARRLIAHHTEVRTTAEVSTAQWQAEA